MRWVAHIKKAGLVLLILGAVAVFGGCGKKGPLYLPEKESTQEK